jgi:hypothetical protein
MAFSPFPRMLSDSGSFTNFAVPGTAKAAENTLAGEHLQTYAV